ncbi:MAG: thioredoxin-disulfide reductase [Anaerolineae bacterium]|nr:thioredoxin-disulfide reductase [Anaerolineae bacterium]
MKYDLIIIGGGPAGLTAAIYAGRAAITPLVLSGGMPGGQISSTALVENYPGFPKGANGFELAVGFQEQAEHFGAEIVIEPATEVDLSVRPFVVKTRGETYQARSVIIATGAFPRRLGIPGEREFFGRGVSTCATCDGFLYKEKRVVVVGGGDSAIDEGLFLAKFASEVIVVHRRDALRAHKQLQERAFANPKMRFVWDSVAEEVLGNGKVTGLRVRNVKSGETQVIETSGVFVYVGLIPATKIFQGQIDLDDAGYVITDAHKRTNVPGVFAAGDVENPDFRQCVVAAGSGATAAIQAERYLSEQESA